MIITGILLVLSFICLLQIGHNQEKNYQELKLKHNKTLEEVRDIKIIVREIKRIL